MNHKRHRPKNRRAGCLLCKPHKGNGMKGRADSRTMQATKSDASMRFQLDELVAEGRYVRKAMPRRMRVSGGSA